MTKDEQKKENLDSKEKLKKKKNKKRVLSRKKARRWIARGVMALIALSLIFISLYWIPANLTYRVRETFSISSAESTELNLVALLPSTGAYQTLTEPEVSWPGPWQAEMFGRVNLIRLEGAIEADETLTAEIVYDVDLSQGKTGWVGEPVTSDELLVEYENQDWSEKAISLIVENDTLATAKRIYDFVSAQEKLPGSGQKAILLAYLNRTIEIPTRVVMGWGLPDSLPLFSQRISDEPSLGMRYWNEAFLQDNWKIMDASTGDRFLGPRLLGWTDGRHLVLDSVDGLEALTQSLAEEAGQQGWESDISSSPAYAVWSLDGSESLEVVPELTVTKTWDGRWAMAIAVVVILIVLEWMMETDHFTKKAKQKV